MDFKHSHTITITHANGKVEHISVDSAGQSIDGLQPGAAVPLYTREEKLMELPADWVYTADKGLTFFGQSEGPYKGARYTLTPHEERTTDPQLV